MKTTRLFKRVSELLSLCIFLGGSVVLIGWIFDIPVLKSISPKFVTMKANTAICFILIGLSLWLSQAKRADNRLCRGITRFCAFIVFLIGFLVFCEYMFGWNSGVDQFLFKESANAVLTSAPGRMALNTSICFLILGLALLMAEAKTVILSYLAHFLIILMGAIAFLSFVGYLYGASPLYIGPHFSTAMALHTTVLFLMTSICGLFVRPQRGLMKTISSDSFGGIVLRRMLPVVIFVPLAAGGFKIYGERTKWFSNEFGVSLVAICNLLIVSVFVYIFSVYLNRLDAKHKAATEAMRENEEKIHLLLNSTAEAIYGIDTNGICTFCNNSCLRLLGYKHPDELLGKNMHWQIHAKRSDGTFFPIEECRVFQALEKGEGTHVDDEVLWRSDGTSFPAEYWSYPQRHNGVVVGVVMTFLDITERKQAAEALREKSALLVKIINSVPDFIFAKDTQLRTIICNEAYASAVGRKPEEMIGHTDIENGWDPELVCGNPAKGIRGFENDDRDALSGKTIHNPYDPANTPKGVLIFDTYKMPLCGKEGEIIGMLGIAHDITERKEAERKLSNSAREWSETFDAMSDGVSIQNDDFVILGVNNALARILNKSKEEIVGQKCFELIHCKDAPIEGCPLAKCKLTKKNEYAETFEPVLGRWVAVSTSPILDEQGNIQKIIHTIRNITDYKNAEKELIQAREQADSANKAKSQFLANMSHEIRTPMSAIMGFSDILSEEELTDQQREYVNTISHSGKHLLQVINDILDFSKIEAGKLDVEKNECSLENLLAVIGSMIYPLAAKKGLEFEIREECSLPANIHTDSARMQQCLINLVNNAIKFTTQGHVYLNVSLEDKNNQPYIRFDVEDTGIGIPADKQQMIFEPFTQASEDTSRKYGGTGLGLTITKQLAKLLGGDLALTSEEGKGSVFSLVIPAGLDALEQKRPSTLPEPEKKHEPNETRYAGRILVVEDNPTNQFLVQTLLAKLGPQCMLACDGVEAVEKATAESFDLILMDIQMPNMNGYEATKALRKKGLKTPIVALTAHAMEGDRQKCIDAGCDDHMAKPINRTKLLEVLDRYLNSRPDSLTDKVEKLCEETKELTDICRQTQPPDQSQPDKPAGTSASE